MNAILPRPLEPIPGNFGSGPCVRIDFIMIWTRSAQKCILFMHNEFRIDAVRRWHRWIHFAFYRARPQNEKPNETLNAIRCLCRCLHTQREALCAVVVDLVPWLAWRTRT